MKKTIIILLLSLLLASCSNASDKKLVIGVLQYMQHPALDSTVEGLEDYLKEHNLDDKVELVIKNAQGDSGTAYSIAQQFVNDDVDLIYAIATQAGQAAFNATDTKQIPIVFNAITDAVEAGIVESNESSGNHVTGVSDAAPLDIQLQLIKEIVPETKKIGMIYNLGEINGKIQVDQVSELAPKYAMETVVVGVSQVTDISSAVEQLAKEVDVLYNITDNMIVSSTALIAHKALEYNIPLFAAEYGPLDEGILAVEGLSYYKLGVQAGDLVNSVLFKNVSPSDLPIKTATDATLKINYDIAEELNITISESLQARANQDEE